MSSARSSKRTSEGTPNPSASKRPKTSKSEKDRLMKTARSLRSKLENQVVRKAINPITLAGLDMVVSDILDQLPLYPRGLATLEKEITLFEPPDIDGDPSFLPPS